MTPEQKAAYVIAQAVSALAAIEAMKAANAYRERRGETQAYPEEAFWTVENEYCISQNAVLSLFHS